MYKIEHPGGVVYLAKTFMVSVRNTGKHRIIPLKPWEFRYDRDHSQWLVDKLVEPERKMFWLTFGRELRTGGYIR